MQNVTEDMVRDVYSRVKEPKALLLTLVADGISPLLLTNEPNGVTSRGQYYEYFPFGFTWAGAGQDEPIKNAKVEIMNRDRRIAEAIRLATGEPKVTVELIRLAAPDTVEMAMTDAKLGDAEVDDPRVTGNLLPKSFKTEPAVSARYIYARTPGLF